MTKEELIKEIEKIKVSLEAHEEQVKDLSHDLNIAKQRLEDINKPKLTEKQLANIHDVIESTVENFDFSNTDIYEPEFAIDYDGKVYLDGISTDIAGELSDDIIAGVESLFGVTEESDDTGSSECSVPSE